MNVSFSTHDVITKGPIRDDFAKEPSADPELLRVCPAGGYETGCPDGSEDTTPDVILGNPLGDCK